PASIRILTDSGIVAGSVTAVVLNILFHVIPNKKRIKPASSAYQQQVS
ncbi:purine permease, partial [Parageobacillus thermoglucosidasius]